MRHEEISSSTSEANDSLFPSIYVQRGESGEVSCLAIKMLENKNKDKTFIFLIFSRQFWPSLLSYISIHGESLSI